MKVPSDLKSIEIRSYQVWKFDVIGFNPNEIRKKIVYTYKWRVTDKLCKTQGG